MDEVVNFLTHLDEKTLTAGGLLLASSKLERLFGNFTVSWHHLAVDARGKTWHYNTITIPLQYHYNTITIPYNTLDSKYFLNYRKGSKRCNLAMCMSIHLSIHRASRLAPQSSAIQEADNSSAFLHHVSPSFNDIITEQQCAWRGS